MSPYDMLIQQITDIVPQGLGRGYNDPEGKAHRIVHALIDVIRDEILRNEMEKKDGKGCDVCGFPFWECRCKENAAYIDKHLRAMTDMEKIEVAMRKAVATVELVKLREESETLRVMIEHGAWGNHVVSRYPIVQQQVKALERYLD